MIAKESIESAYCFFHQKWRVYSFSTDERQRDDIEYAIGSYVLTMNRELFEYLSGGRNSYLQDHSTFSDDISKAVDKLDKLL